MTPLFGAERDALHWHPPHPQNNVLTLVGVKSSGPCVGPWLSWHWAVLVRLFCTALGMLSKEGRLSWFQLWTVLTEGGRPAGACQNNLLSLCLGLAAGEPEARGNALPAPSAQATLHQLS